MREGVLGKKLKVIFLLAAVLLSIILLSVVFGFLAFYVPSGTTQELNSTSNITFSEGISVDSHPGSGGGAGGGGSSAPLFSITGVTQTSYLRNLVGETYEDGNWLPDESASSVQYTDGQITFNVTNYSSADDVNFQIQPSTAFGGFIPSTKETNWISLNSSLQYFPDQQIFFSDNTFTNSYNASYTSYKFDITTLREAETVPDSRYLQVPSNILMELKPLALKITQNFTSPFDQATAIEDFLQQNYHYDLDYTPAPSGVDPVIWFLFNSTRGVCTHFNSAFVLLARSIGIPARLCAGFLIDPSSNYQTVASTQRHAYSEVLFKDLGWITFDATGFGNPADGNSSEGIPFIQIVDPTQGATVSGQGISIAGQAVGFGKDAELSINNTSFNLTYWNSIDGDFSFSNSSSIVDGTYAVMVSAVDGQGNSASNVVTFTVDNTSPQVNIEYPVNGTVVSSSSISVEGNIAGANMDELKPFIIDSRFRLVAWNSSSSTFSFANITDVTGDVSLQVSFRNTLGIVGSSSVSFEAISTAQIPTLTTITHFSPVGVKGSNFTVEGRVVDSNKNGLNNLNVVVYLTKSKNEIGTICGQGETVNGNFSITCYVGIDVQVGEYQVVANTEGDTQYSGSWSDPQIMIMAETSISMAFPSEVILGRTFTIGGTLEETLSNQPVTDEPLLLTLEGETPYSLVTDNSGSFNLTLAPVWTPGNYTIYANFDGSETYLNSSMSGTLRILGITILPTTNTTLIRSQSVSLTARVFAGDLPVNNEPLTLSASDQIIGGNATDSLGYFDLNFPVWNSSPFGDQPLGPITIEYDAPNYPEVSARQNATIVAKTSLTCNASQMLKPADTLNITVSLNDDQEQPMENMPIKLECVFNKHDSSTLMGVTASDGKAAYTDIVIPSGTSSNLTYTVSFPGNAYYLPSAYYGSVKVFSTSSPINVLLIIFGAVLPASLTILSAVIWKKKKASKSNVEQSAPLVSEVPPIVVPALPSKEKAQLHVRFPQISDPFPNVWGVKEPLTIEIELEGIDEPVSPEDFSLRIDDEREISLKASGGTFLSNCVFDVKGIHRLKAKFFGNSDFEEVISEVEVKIVDYREEIVDLFNSFFKSAKTKFQGVREEMTPRELQTTLVNQIDASKQEPLETAVSVFEVADYSLHEMARRDYERIYIALKKLEG
jgi:transglutaminase-like putative cysteine protease